MGSYAACLSDVLAAALVEAEANDQFGPGYDPLQAAEAIAAAYADVKEGTG